LANPFVILQKLRLGEKLKRGEKIVNAVFPLCFDNFQIYLVFKLIAFLNSTIQLIAMELFESENIKGSWPKYL